MSKEALQNINKAVTKTADIAAHPFDTPTQRTLREWQKEENSLEGKPNGNTHSILPLPEWVGWTGAVVAAATIPYWAKKIANVSHDMLMRKIDNNVAKKVERRKLNNQEKPNNQEKK